MKKIILTIILCSILLLGITGCEKIKPKENKDNNEQIKEKFSFGHILDDGRVFFTTFSVPYGKDSYLSEALVNKELSIDEFFKNLNYLEGIKDGDSKLYVYNPMRRIFGNEQFYVISCDSMDGIKDIYVAKNLGTLNNVCSININNLEGISMTIKEGTLTNTGATVILQNSSDKNISYGNPYYIEKKVGSI